MHFVEYNLVGSSVPNGIRIDGLFCYISTFILYLSQYYVIIYQAKMLWNERVARLVSEHYRLLESIRFYSERRNENDEIFSV